MKQVKWKNWGLYGLLIVMIIAVTLTGLLEAGKSATVDSPIIWDVESEGSCSGRFSLTPDEPVLVVPFYFDIPLHSKVTIHVQPSNDQSKIGYPVKFHYSGLAPESDFIVVYNVIEGDISSAGVNNIRIDCQRVAVTSEEVNFTLTLDDNWKEELELQIYLRYATYEFTLSKSDPTFIPYNSGSGSNQKFKLVFYSSNSSNCNACVTINHYQNVTEQEFILVPGEYREIIATTVIFNTAAREAMLDQGNFEITISLTGNETGAMAELRCFNYPLRPYNYLKQIDQDRVSGLELFPVVMIFLLAVVRKRKKSEQEG